MRRYVFRLALLSLAVFGPNAVFGDDQQIAQQIIEKLQAEKKAGTLKGFSIDLQVDEGTVWLTGRVANEQQQARALDLARRVPGVTQVVNDLTVNTTAAKPSVAANPAPPAAAPAPMEPVAVPAYNPPVAQNFVPAQQVAQTQAIPFTPIESPRSIPATPINPAPAATVAVELPPARSAPTPIEAVPLAAEPQAEYPEPAPAPQAVAKASQPERKAGTQTSVLSSVSKTLMSAVHGKGSGESATVQPASNATPIGSGVDASASSRRGVVQAAQPVANVPYSDTPQPLPGVGYAAGYGGAPQMAMMPMQYMVPVYAQQPQVPLAVAPAGYGAGVSGGVPGAPQPMYLPGSGVGVAPARYDHPQMPGYAWPSYAAHPNYAAVTYPKQYSPTAWPYIGPFYPYPQVPLGWRKVTMEWDDGWWFLDFKDRRTMYNH
jgi:hypothetical protein